MIGSAILVFSDLRASKIPSKVVLSNCYIYFLKEILNHISYGFYYLCHPMLSSIILAPVHCTLEATLLGATPLKSLIFSARFLAIFWLPMAQILRAPCAFSRDLALTRAFSQSRLLGCTLDGDTWRTPSRTSFLWWSVIHVFWPVIRKNSVSQ